MKTELFLFAVALVVSVANLLLDGPLGLFVLPLVMILVFLALSHQSARHRQERDRFQ